VWEKYSFVSSDLRNPHYYKAKNMKDIGYLVARKRQSRKIFIVKSREKLVRCRAPEY